MSAVDIKRQISKRIDELEISMAENLVLIDIPVNHLFCHGMYIRSVSCPAGATITTKIHKTEHPFTVSKGKVKVMNEEGQWTEISAPYTGITKRGTRRVVLVIEDCVWTTYHAYKGMKSEYNALPACEKELITDRIEARVVEKHHINHKELWHTSQLHR
jgi:hypothetical protein